MMHLYDYPRAAVVHLNFRAGSTFQPLLRGACKRKKILKGGYFKGKENHKTGKRKIRCKKFQFIGKREREKGINIKKYL